MHVIPRRAWYALLGLLLATAGAYWVLFKLGVREPAPPQLSGPLAAATLEVGGRTRRFSYFAPTALEPGAPLLLVFHGGGGSPQQMRAYTGFEFEELADEQALVVAYPQGIGGQWNTCQKGRENEATKQDVDDVGFARALIAWFHSRYATDTARAFAVGFSNGGHMVYRLATQAPEAFAGFAAISANQPADSDSKCEAPKRAVSMLIINGTQDPINPYGGGELSPYGLWSLGPVRSTDDTALSFLANEARSSPTRRRYQDRDGDPRTGIEKRTWRSESGVESSVITVEGGGHTIPQRRYVFPRFFGRTSAELDAPEEVWSVFDRIQHENRAAQNNVISEQPVSKTGSFQ